MKLSHTYRFAVIFGLSVAVVFGPGNAAYSDVSAPWQGHVIDSGPKGADGIRWLDFNGDDALDAVTGWEQSGKIRLCVNPGPANVRKPWRGVEVGQVASPEDAVPVDLDGDGAIDIVSSCEGATKSVFMHWGPRKRDRLLDAAAWKTEALPATAGKEMWMYAVPAQIDGQRGVDLVVGSKGDRGSVSWLESPAEPRRLDQWKLHRIRKAGWIMSLLARDLDGDGDVDAILSDRKGDRRGVFWLENPGGEDAARGKRWTEHRIGAQGEEVMFLDFTDFDGDKRPDMIATAKPRKAFLIRQPNDPNADWPAETFELPGDTGRAKGIRAGDIDLDGRVDLVFSCEGATGEKSGVSWYRAEGGKWTHHDVSGRDGAKFDHVDLLDLDADGDMDIATTEENDNLGVIWYENPTRRADGAKARGDSR